MGEGGRGRRAGAGPAAQQLFSPQVALSRKQDLVAGKNGLLFAYGVTSSGKTFTVQGTPTQAGLLSRSLDVLFNTIHGHRAPRCSFTLDKWSRIKVQVGAALPLLRDGVFLHFLALCRYMRYICEIDAADGIPINS